jgi:hypothetical protein
MKEHSRNEVIDAHIRSGTKPGERVGAILSSDTKARVVRFLGFGRYESCEVPPEDIGGLNLGIENPKIRLDSGKVVWGCECWWGGAAKIDALLQSWKAEGFEIVEVDIDDARREAAG